MLVTVSGRVIEVNPIHCENALLPIVSTPVVMGTEVNPLQSMNALSLIILILKSISKTHWNQQRTTPNWSD